MAAPENDVGGDARRDIMTRKCVELQRYDRAREEALRRIRAVRDPESRRLHLPPGHVNEDAGYDE